MLAIAACEPPSRETLPPYTDGHADLIAATGRRRLLEPRLSAFPFASWTGKPIPLSVLVRDVGPGRFRAADSRIKRQLAARRTAEAFGAAAALDILRQEPGAALVLLDEALAESPDDVRLLIDRAAAVLEADRRGDAAAEVAMMADRLSDRHATAEQAWSFNRALLLERIGMNVEAAAAFRAAAGGDWAEEAAARAAALDRTTAGESWRTSKRRLLEAAASGDRATVSRLVERWPLAASAVVEDELLGRLDAAGEGDLSFRQASFVAEALARRGDPFLAEALDTLRREPMLARAHAHYVRGRLAQRKGRPEEAQRLLEAATAAFDRAGSPFGALADLRWASCGHQRGQYAESRARVRRALARTSNRFLDLRARLEWRAGALEIVRGHPAAALEAYRRALELYEQARAPEGIGALAMLHAETWSMLGEWRVAWSHRRRALRLLPQVSDPELQRTILDEAAEASARDGLLGLATALQDRVVASAREADNDFALPVALAQRAHIRIQRGDFAGAGTDLGTARRKLAALPANDFRSHLEAFLLPIEAEASRADPARAMEKLEAAVVYYERMERWVAVRAAVLHRALLSLQTGDEAAALEALRRATALGERLRAQGGAERVRGVLDEEALPLYAELVRLELGRGRVAEAFLYAERSRARRLADALGLAEISLAALCVSLPADTALVAYYDLGSRLVAFVVKRDAAVAVELTRNGLEAEMATLRRLAKRGGSADVWRPVLAALDERLLARLRPHLRGAATLIVVPHRDLVSVPFGALYHTASRRYLVQQYRLVVSPSATVFQAALARSRATGEPGGAVLAAAVAEPAAGLAPVLDPLPHASSEARAVAAAYAESRLLSGGAATRSRFLELARQSAVVHFAGHAVASAVDPGLSFLALDATGGDGGALYADEIARHTWPLTRLVFLSACRTTQRSTGEAEGIQGLARAFLAAGVPAVVGTLWKVDDEFAAAFGARFHRSYAAGLDAASALRAAQLSMLADDPDAPPAWAAFELIGGVTETPLH